METKRGENEMSKKKGSPTKPVYPANKLAKTGNPSGKGRSNAPTQKKPRRKSRNFGVPMVATGDSGVPYTYPTGNSEDY